MANCSFGLGKASLFVCIFVFVSLRSIKVMAATKKYQFNIEVKNVSRLCHVKPIVTVNGRFPGPTVYAREDGPAYITQCPIKPGNNYVYDFSVTGQRGTLWWHAHILWLRATVYGAIVILAKQETLFPFPRPDGEEVIVFGEWWHADVEEIVKQGNALGLPPKFVGCSYHQWKTRPAFPVF
ncbi:hypothetical protein QVD17_18892 [Tagetes erecta]|uniref:Plastocyanin-like domain-containing protein n=1 Tax=Tagetes erecta TaxID=13708 RepID=A0AAD8NW28_TARER|nr:hypothetical protein QVD17_18892 [Tagetes erecta]